MKRGAIVIKAALLSAGIGLLTAWTAPAQACAYGYYYYPGYGCRGYDYGFPAGAIGGLLFGLLDHNHGYRGYHGGGGFAGAIVRHGGGRSGGVIARGGGHERGHLGGGFGSSAPHAAAPHAAAPHAAAHAGGGGHKK
jgi:hypothetical protein